MYFTLAQLDHIVTNKSGFSLPEMVKGVRIYIFPGQFVDVFTEGYDNFLGLDTYYYEGD